MNNINKKGRIPVLCILLLILLLAYSHAAAIGEPIQDCHKVTSTATTTTQKNKSKVRLWHVETACEPVTEEVNGIAEGWAEELGPELQKNYRLDVEIRYSRTGHRWMSFLVQARTTYKKETTAERVEARTYDMETGDRVTLSLIFDDEAVWDLMAERVRETLTNVYWPDEAPDAEKLEELCSRSALEKADFTLHGMSLVLHYPAELLYPEHHTLMEVTFFYPEIQAMMTEQGYSETDNISYYYTCALTFDDGPKSNTPKVLDALMETGARGTFFVIGNLVKNNHDMIQREHDNGHAVASHNWHHGNATKASGAELRRMPEKVNKAMIKAIGIPVRYDRVPGGRYPPMIKAKVGWAYIQWSLDTYDWRGRTPAEVMGTVKRLLHDGDIILCHDIKPNTAESTRQIVHYLEEQGYMPLTIDELFAKDGVTLEPNKVYYRCDHGEYTIRKDD